MIILGVDPGTLATGYGVIERKSSGWNVLDCDVVKTKSSDSLPLRLKFIYNVLFSIIEKYHPDELAIESAFYGKNVQSAMKIGLARGAAILAAVNNEIPTSEYSPREIKKAIVGNGAASKEQVQYMVKSLLQIKSMPKFLDVSDALAVAICHYNRTITSIGKYSKKSNKSAKSTNWAKFIKENPNRIVKIK